MSKEMENYTIQETDTIGEVQIADDVVGTIAALAAMEVEGVAGMAGSFTNELVGKFGVKNLSKGVKVNVEENAVYVDITLVVSYGYSIPKVTRQVQERVVAAIENMTGLSVEEVNIRVSSVNMEQK